MCIEEIKQPQFTLRSAWMSCKMASSVKLSPSTCRERELCIGFHIVELLNILISVILRHRNSLEDFSFITFGLMVQNRIKEDLDTMLVVFVNSLP